jgi:hypothetical protein
VRVVFDTNVIVAGIVAQGLCHEILGTHLPEHQPILSPRLWNELVEVLRDRFGLETEELPVLTLYQRLASWVEPTALASPVCRDPDDDWVLATAHAGGAEAVVTGDDDLLVLVEHEGIAILSPRQFLERLESSRETPRRPSR